MTKKARTPLDGHRQRLRARFLRDLGESMPDYEILELVLMESIKRQDVKPIARALIEKYGSLAETLAASPESLKAIHGIGEASLVSLKLISSAMQRASRQHTVNSHVINGWESLLDYCRVRFGALANEEFHAIILNRQQRISDHLVLGVGSISDVVITPREVVKKVLDHHASGVVLVHNHPGGSAKPSANDIKTTTKLRSALKSVDVHLFDHLIIARGGEILSFKNKGIL